jgi:branched-chain amino acid transport system substrate-binding protein
MSIGTRNPALLGLTLMSLALTGCGGSVGGDEEESSSDTLIIGFVTAETGPLSGFGEANTFVIDQMNDYFADNPLEVDGTEYDVEIIAKDSQSDSTRAGEVAAELINSDGADILMAASTPDITNPVSEQCEASSVLCLTSVAPWQPFAIRDGSAPSELKYSYHFFWGLEDVAAVYQNIWAQVDTSSEAAGLFPNDPDGQAWSANFPGLVEAGGFTIDNPGLYENGTKDFSAQISQYKGKDILVGVPIPPDFTTFWQQAKQQGYSPEVATIGKALLFPSAVEGLGETGDNLSSEVWWHPTAAYASSLTGQSAQELADAYESDTDKQWTQPLGFAHALFEVAAAAVEKAGSTDADDLVAAMADLEVSTVVGDLAWGSDPNVPPYIAKTPLAGGQWRLTDGGDHQYDLVVVENELAPDVPLGGEVEPLP